MSVVCSYDRDMDDQSKVPTGQLNGSGKEKIVRLAKPSAERRADAARQLCLAGEPVKIAREQFSPKSPLEDSGASRESRAELSPHEAASLHPHALFRVLQSESNRS